MFNKKYGVISIGVLAIAMGQIITRIPNVIFPTNFGCYYVHGEKKPRLISH